MAAEYIHESRTQLNENGPKISETARAHVAAGDCYHFDNCPPMLQRDSSRVVLRYLNINLGKGASSGIYVHTNSYTQNCNFQKLNYTITVISKCSEHKASAA